MVCLDGLNLHISGLIKLMRALNITVTNIKYDNKWLVSEACFKMPDLSYYLPLLTPFIIKLAFTILVLLLLHLFYSLIPDKI
ncbi:hypothetical protein [Cyanothece sp. BG0011]|uniref:hypothetical protein n=1 Tax=Cyanothece sp. BG0011 TaxID=2082950 RepID=UPI000D1FCCA4|nr:hypothetical protein [Cyanothece sp. BG0011]